MALAPNRLGSLLALGACAAALLGAAPAQASVSCDRVASPTGSDSAAGTESAPWRTISKLTSALPAGSTGCLRQGTYGGGEPRLHNPDVELTSFPGERATVTSMIEVFPTAARARIHHLTLDATHTVSTATLKVQADDTVISDNEITKGGDGICIQVATFNAAERVIIERNRIYDCGPADSKYDHQIYLQSSRHAIVRQNILTGNDGGWGVHLYSDADGTLIEHNIIDGNRGGVVFAGDGTKTSDNNTVRNNVITYSGPRWNIEASWSGGPAGTGNSAHHNCLYTPGPDGPGGVGPSGGGFSASSNTVLATSPYVDRAEGNLRLKQGSPCRAIAEDVVATLDGAAPAPDPDPQPQPEPDPDAPVIPVPGPVGTPAPATPPATTPTMPRRRTAHQRRRVFLSIARASRRHTRRARNLRVTGRVAASAARRRVLIQVLTRSGWRTVRVTHTRGTALRANVALGRRVKGFVRLRAFVPGLGASEITRIRV